MIYQQMMILVSFVPYYFMMIKHPKKYQEKKTVIQQKIQKAYLKPKKLKEDYKQEILEK